jgi:putative ABC transport system substrate-binding protein
MKRREFITLFVGAAAAWPLNVRAQQGAPKHRIGVLLVGLSPASKATQHFRRGLRDAGYFEGRDVAIEWRSAAGDYSRVPELAADLLRSGVDVIIQDSTYGTVETMRLTSTIPIVMALVVDPVGSKLTHPRLTARPSGLSKPVCASGLTPAPTKPLANEKTSCRLGYIATTGIGPTPASMIKHPSADSA